MSRGSLGRGAALLVGALTLAIVGLPGVAGAKPINDVALVGGGSAVWGPAVNESACTYTGYVTVVDGFYGNGNRDDAYDNGGVIAIDGTGWDDPDGDGAYKATAKHQSLRVGPKRLSGLKISRVDTAFAKGPTLRSLIKFVNGGSQKRTVNVVWDADLGSDSQTDVRSSSNGDTSFTTADRWVVSSDSATSPGDPVLLHVFWGKRARKGLAEVIQSPEGGNDCIEVRYRITVPAGKTRYLLIFLEMRKTNGAGAKGAVKFNKQASWLFGGLSNSVKNKTLNWRL